MPLSMVPVGDAQLCVDTFGASSDPAVLLMGGATSSMAWWEPVFCERIASAAPVAPESVDGGLAYKQHCASCHGADREGSVGPALKGSSFDTRWKAKPEELEKVITATMPIGEGHSLPANAYHAITQYVLAGASAPSAAGEAARAGLTARLSAHACARMRTRA